MSNITCYNFNGADVRTVVLPNGEPGFVGKDVAERLGYVDTAQAIRQHCRGALLQQPIPDALGRMQQTRVLTEADVLRLIVSSNMPSAQRFEAWVFDEVLPTIRRTGSFGQQTPQQASNVFALAMVESMARTLRMSDSGVLLMYRQVANVYAPEAVSAIPVYAIDAPTTATSAPTSSMPTASLTDLLREHEIDMAAVTANKLLAQAGIIEQLTRPSSKGAAKKFWSVTEKGSIFGKNVTSPNNPKETQPHWYRQCAKTLIETYLLK